MTKRSLAIVLCVVALLFTAACGKAASLEEYEIQGDTVKSVTAVVGERKVTGTSSSTSNGVTTKTYTYASDTVAEDLAGYAQYLMNGGYTCIADMDLSVSPGSTQFATESKDAGQLVIIQLDYDVDGNAYKVTLAKGEGTLTYTD